MRFKARIVTLHEVFVNFTVFIALVQPHAPAAHTDTFLLLQLPQNAWVFDLCVLRKEDTSVSPRF